MAWGRCCSPPPWAAWRGALSAPGWPALLWATSPLRHPERPPAGRRRHGAAPLALALFAWLALRPGPGALDLAGLERGLRPRPELQAGARPGPRRPAAAWPAARGLGGASGGGPPAPIAGGSAGPAWPGVGSPPGSGCCWPCSPACPRCVRWRTSATALTQVLSGVPLHLAYLVGAHPQRPVAAPPGGGPARARRPSACSRAGQAPPCSSPAGALALLSLGKLAAGYPKYVAGPWPLLAAAAGAALATWLPPGAAAGVPARRRRRPGRGGPDRPGRGGRPDPRGRARSSWRCGWPREPGCWPWPRPWARPARPPSSWGSSSGAGLATSASQAARPGSTTYFYGAGGQVAAGRWLADTLHSQEAPAGRSRRAALAVADREVAYHALAYGRWGGALRGHRALDGRPRRAPGGDAGGGAALGGAV